MADPREVWKLSARPGNPVTLINQTGAAPNTLASLAAAGGAAVTAAAIDNDNDRDVYADFALQWKHTSAPSATTPYVELYIIRTVDGINFEDFVASNTPASVVLPGGAYVGVFPVRPVATTQVAVIRGVILPPLDFYVAIRNAASTAFDTAAATMSLKMLSYQREGRTV